jgi:hypothetical protein
MTSLPATLITLTASYADGALLLLAGSKALPAPGSLGSALVISVGSSTRADF